MVPGDFWFISDLHKESHQYGAKRQEDCALLSFSERIFLSYEVEKRTKQHVYPQALQSIRARCNNPPHNAFTIHIIIRCFRARQTLKTHHTHCDAPFWSTSLDIQDNSKLLLYTTPCRCLGHSKFTKYSHWTNHIKTLLSMEVIISVLKLIFLSSYIRLIFSLL